MTPRGPLADYFQSTLVRICLTSDGKLPTWILELPSYDNISNVRKLANIYANPSEYRKIVEGLVTNQTNHNVAMSLLATNKRYIEIFAQSILSRVLYIVENLVVDVVSGLRHAYNTIRDISHNALPLYVVYYNRINMISEQETVRFFEELGNVVSMLQSVVEPVYVEYLNNINANQITA